MFTPGGKPENRPRGPQATMALQHPPAPVSQPSAHGFLPTVARYYQERTG